MILSAAAKNESREEKNAMNTDKIFAEAIANEYAPKDASKVVALKKLDRKAKGPANIFAYSFGVLMTLVLGVGMCLSMQVIGSGGTLLTGVGVLLGILGIAGVCLNYPIYKKLLRSGKEKYAFEIMQLAREISESAE
ncbi:dihydropteridine reductase [Pseudoflavonifractor sp. AF19-9AC]|uniref:dihydropteridine reductase n=1 Tax=Pseudoflavonifractor sp. AF19-9AC TaxID=2292244 RepID=UPI00325B6FCB